MGPCEDQNRVGCDTIEVRVNKVYAAIFSIIMFWVAVTVIVVAEDVSPWNVDFGFDERDKWMFLGSLFLLVIVHEALHALAALQWGNVPFSSIRFGFKWKWLAPYCHFSRPIRMGAFRVFLLLPLGVTTAVTGLVLLLDPALWTLFLFCLAFSASAADVLTYFRVQDYRSDLWVKDHPSEPGCFIWPEGQTPLE